MGRNTCASAYDEAHPMCIATLIPKEDIRQSHVEMAIAYPATG